MHKILVLILFFCGCSTSNVVQELDYFQSHRISTIPSNVVAKMDSFIVSRTGQDLFYKSFFYDTSESGFFRGEPSYQRPNIAENSRYMAQPYHLFVYYFHLPNKPWHKWKLWWPVDTSGDFIQNNLPYGIPDCQSALSNCSFSIDSLEAVGIAKKAGLSSGVTPLCASFGFENGKYFWMVGTTTFRSKSSAKVVIYYVDINTGEMVGKGGWSVVE